MRIKGRLAASIAAGAAGPSGILAILFTATIFNGISGMRIAVLLFLVALGILIGIASYLPYSYLKTNLRLHAGYDFLFHMLISAFFVIWFFKDSNSASQLDDAFLLYVFIALGGVPAPIVFGKILSKYQLWQSQNTVGES